jgi:UDP-N-acetyl-D-galactosamine dehydrogenase
MMIKNNVPVKGANILLLGITFKENCPDVRNTKVVDIVRGLNTYDVNVTVYDPWANPEEVAHEYGIDTITKLPEGQKYEAIVLAVAHNEFTGEDWRKWAKKDGIIYDVKGCLEKGVADARL